MDAAAEFLKRLIEVLQVFLLLVDRSGIGIAGRLGAHGVAFGCRFEGGAYLCRRSIHRVDHALYKLRIILRDFGDQRRSDLVVQPELQAGLQFFSGRLRRQNGAQNRQQNRAARAHQ